MPVKWDADKDKFLLNCLLMDASVNIGSAVVENIISSWPSEFGDAPTKKAVGEHFFKIRKLNKKFATTGGNGTTTPTPSPTKATKTRATPVKKTTAGTKTPTSKRKRNGVVGRSDDDEDGEETATPAVLQGEVQDLAAAETDESPTKRARRVVKYEETDEDGAQMSGSDFRAEEEEDDEA